MAARPRCHPRLGALPALLAWAGLLPLPTVPAVTGESEKGTPGRKPDCSIRCPGPDEGQGWRAGSRPAARGLPWHAALPAPSHHPWQEEEGVPGAHTQSEAGSGKGGSEA